MLSRWTARLAAELGVDLDVDQRLLLDVAREAAHSVQRPAAPLTTFVVGYAAGRRGGGPDAVAECARTAARLSAEWAAEQRAAEQRAVEERAVEESPTQSRTDQES